jgi:hypothetical protein
MLFERFGEWIILLEIILVIWFIINIGMLISKNTTKYKKLFIIVLLCINILCIVFCPVIVIIIVLCWKQVVPHIIIIIICVISIIISIKIIRKTMDKEIEKEIKLKIKSEELLENDTDQNASDYMDNDLWMCSVCRTINKIYVIKCKKCGKILKN